MVTGVALVLYTSVSPSPSIHQRARKLFSLTRGGDKVAFKSAHGKYLVAEPNGQAHANRPVLSSWETFTINHYGNGKVSLKGDHGKWLVAESTGELMANREKVGSFDTDTAST